MKKSVMYTMAGVAVVSLVVLIAVSTIYLQDTNGDSLATSGPVQRADISDRLEPPDIPTTDQQRQTEMTLLLIGDSLTAGYGLPQNEGFTAQLENALIAAGYSVNVINGGVSGDTTAAGYARLHWLLDDEIDAVMVELGANDALRGIDPAQTDENLRSILTTLEEKNLPVLLAGMRAPPNLGKNYEEEFNAVFPRLADEKDVLFYPFFLKDVAAQSHLNQNDGIHPNKEGVNIIVENILPIMTKLLEKAQNRIANRADDVETNTSKTEQE